MTPCYKCSYVITGNSTNKGPFREEGAAFTLRDQCDKGDISRLREKFEHDALAAFNEVTQKGRPPKYLGVTELTVLIDRIELMGD